jgi:DNA-binding Lrp family transcriptional regulator
MSYVLQDDDIRILQLLQHDARLTTKEIADKIGKTPTPVYERIRRMEKEGIIKGYVALLDRSKIDRGLIGFTLIHLKEHSQTMLNNFKKESSNFAEVMECYHMTGEFDFILKIAIRDMQEYNEFLVNKLATLPNVGTVQSVFVLSEGKVETAFPLRQPAKKKAKK